VKCGKRVYRLWSEHEKKLSHCLPSANVSNREKVTYTNNRGNLVVFSLRCEVIKIFTSFSPSCIASSSSSVKKPALCKACAYA
jgi:hypothetical protein